MTTMTPLFNLTPTPEVVRIISVGSFRRRLFVPEKVAIHISVDPVVQVLQRDLDSSRYVELDSPELISGLAYLVSVGILTEERMVQLRQDGTIEEKP